MTGPSMIAHCFLLFLLPPSPLQGSPLQGGGTNGSNGKTDSAPGADVGSAQAEALRERIHGMRMGLLLGGEKVQKAEVDATQFYKEKTELVERRMDSLGAELTEMRANYQVVLENALQGDSQDKRKSTLREAGQLRQKIQSLESEKGDLTDRRKRLERLVQAVEARGRERERLAARIDTEPVLDDALAAPLGDLGLAPEFEVLAPASVLDDTGLVGDLLAQDPVGGRRLLFEADPSNYWDLFPLSPPSRALRGVLKFPPPDLPGQR